MRLRQCPDVLGNPYNGPPARSIRPPGDHEGAMRSARRLPGLRTPPRTGSASLAHHSAAARMTASDRAAGRPRPGRRRCARDARLDEHPVHADVEAVARMTRHCRRAGPTSRRTGRVARVGRARRSSVRAARATRGSRAAAGCVRPASRSPTSRKPSRARDDHDRGVTSLSPARDAAYDPLRPGMSRSTTMMVGTPGGLLKASSRCGPDDG